MSIIKGAAHHDICSKQLHDVVVGAAHRNSRFRCSAPYGSLSVLGYKYCAALPLCIFLPLNTEGL